VVQKTRKNSATLITQLFLSFTAPGCSIWVFPKIGVPQNGKFIMENPIKMDDLGGTTILGHPHIAMATFSFEVSGT